MNKRNRLRVLLGEIFDLRQKAHRLEQEAIALRDEIEADSRAKFEQKRMISAINSLPAAMRAELMRRASEI